MKGKKFGFPEYVRGGGRFTVTCVVMCSVWRFVLSYHIMCIGGPYIVNLSFKITSCRNWTRLQSG